MKHEIPQERGQFEVIWTKNAQFDLELIIEYIITPPKNKLNNQAA